MDLHKIITFSLLTQVIINKMINGNNDGEQIKRLFYTYFIS